MDKSASEKLDKLFDRPDLKVRATAAVIDGFIGCMVIFIFVLPGFIIGGTFVISATVFLGCVFAALFMLFKDGLHNSSSPGKKILNLTVTGPGGNFINLAESASRNLVPSLPFWAMAVYFLSTLLVPYVGDIIVYIGLLPIPASIGLVIYDVIHMLNDRETSLRWAEVESATVVEETS